MFRKFRKINLFPSYYLSQKMRTRFPLWREGGETLPPSVIFNYSNLGQTPIFCSFLSNMFSTKRYCAICSPFSLMFAGIWTIKLGDWKTKFLSDNEQFWHLCEKVTQYQRQCTVQGIMSTCFISSSNEWTRNNTWH